MQFWKCFGPDRQKYNNLKFSHYKFNHYKCFLLSFWLVSSPFKLSVKLKNCLRSSKRL